MIAISDTSKFEFMGLIINHEFQKLKLIYDYGLHITYLFIIAHMISFHRSFYDFEKLRGCGARF